MTSRRRWRGRAVALARWCVLAAVVAMPLVAAGGATANAAQTGFDVAFNSGSLWTYNPSPGGSNSGLGMMSGTSPAITILADGSYEEAFQANTGTLWLVNSAGGGSNTGLGMAAGTSPAITALPDGSYEVAFNSSSGSLWTMNPGPGGSDTGLGVAAGTSPAITALPDGSYEVAFNSSSGSLWTMNPGPGGSDTSLGVENGTSPAITSTAPTSTGTGTENCGATNNCTPQTFADALLGYPGVDAPVTASNEFAIEAWEEEEGGGAGCPGQPANAAPWAYSPGPSGNPLNTTQPEPGDSDWNSVGVKIYADADGQTCWYWGITANGTALTNGLYGAILNVLNNPSSDSYTQCVDLANAVAPPGDPVADVWGTPNFSDLC
jgi:hypothetical protein